MRWRRFKGLIYPGMAASYEDAKRVSERKSIWMVEYLRERRSRGRLRAFFRRNYFEDQQKTQEQA